MYSISGIKYWISEIITIEIEDSRCCNGYNDKDDYNGNVKSMGLIERKVTKIGNSIGITLPPEILSEVGLSQGDDVQIEVKDGNIILRKKEHLQLPKGVDAAFMDILSDVIKEHDVAFKGLVDR